jgi:hypothetical protein
MTLEQPNHWRQLHGTVGLNWRFSGVGNFLGDFYRNNDRTPDMARCSKPGSVFVAPGHCTISMKA